jgi:hypothetical protein
MSLKARIPDAAVLISLEPEEAASLAAGPRSETRSRRA